MTFWEEVFLKKVIDEAYSGLKKFLDSQSVKFLRSKTDIRTTQKYSHVDVLSQSQVFAAQKKENRISSRNSGTS